MTATGTVGTKKNDLIETKSQLVEPALIQSHSNNTENSEKDTKTKKTRKPATPKKVTSRDSLEISAQDPSSTATTDALVENSIIQDQLEIQIIQPVIQEDKSVLSQEPPFQTSTSKKSKKATRPKEYVDVQESSELATPAVISSEPSRPIADEYAKSVAPLEKKKKSKEERQKKQTVDSTDGDSRMPVPSILDKMLGISN